MRAVAGFCVLLLASVCCCWLLCADKANNVKSIAHSWHRMLHVLRSLSAVRQQSLHKQHRSCSPFTAAYYATNRHSQSLFSMLCFLIRLVWDLSECRLQTVCAMPPSHLQATNATVALHALSAAEREPNAPAMASAAMSREPVFVTAVIRYAHACSSSGHACNMKTSLRACMQFCVSDIHYMYCLPLRCVS